jgi:hypothetical protein
MTSWLTLHWASQPSNSSALFVSAQKFSNGDLRLFEDISLRSNFQFVMKWNNAHDVFFTHHYVATSLATSFESESDENLNNFGARADGELRQRLKYEK